MKKFIFSTIGIIGLALVVSGTVFAQGMMGFQSLSSDNATTQSQQQEEQEGKKFLDDLSGKTIACSQLKDAAFDKIGEYFMGQSIGDTSRHIAMNGMMKSMMGEQGEEQMHIAWGKRGSGCDTSAAFSSQVSGFMPMMQMMTGGWPMMNFGFSSFGGLGWIFMIFWWMLIIVGIAAFIRWVIGQSRGSYHHDKSSSLEILKERYAKGEIDRKEFEDKKKDLV